MPFRIPARTFSSLLYIQLSNGMWKTGSDVTVLKIEDGAVTGKPSLAGRTFKTSKVSWNKIMVNDVTINQLIAMHCLFWITLLDFEENIISKGRDWSLFARETPASARLLDLCACVLAEFQFKPCSGLKRFPIIFELYCSNNDSCSSHINM